MTGTAKTEVWMNNYVWVILHFDVYFKDSLQSICLARVHAGEGISQNVSDAGY